ncbi:helix-turn-helix domain-containing protein [Mucilaginibacter sp. JRF]|uniref:helix-turn-helix domain-containing protein n=1 Tax=Mucilaginibacter sp. JRF TaxID=2780088 RepID=UPI0018815390|nr:helix-turn-helix domain-containing protein [Mucilaginibacter sp. JRF]MBE9583104.1 helix-turn-helix domain-containing protein [Mucilaginibacter sp. JRF]
MDVHHGRVIEKVIRQEGYSISEVARLTNVNRRSIYNWFHQQTLKIDIIYKIGLSIKHDFSVEFPSLFKSSDFIPNAGNKVNTDNQQDSVSEQQISSNDVYWKDKYISLLEKYNDALSRSIEQNPPKNPREKNIS